MLVTGVTSPSLTVQGAASRIIAWSMASAAFARKFRPRQHALDGGRRDRASRTLDLGGVSSGTLGDLTLESGSQLSFQNVGAVSFKNSRDPARNSVACMRSAPLSFTGGTMAVHEHHPWPGRLHRYRSAPAR